MNSVNEENFNETMKGYIVRACKESKLPKEILDEIFQGLRWATSDMTMEDARVEYDNYCAGKIKLK